MKKKTSLFLQENIFDVTDLQSEFGDRENNLISKCGSLEVAFAYDAPMRKMTVHVLQARDIPSKDRGGATHTQVSLRKQSIKGTLIPYC